MTRRLILAVIVALFVSLLVQWAIENAVETRLIEPNRLPDFRYR